MIKILELYGGIGAPRKALVNLGINHKCIDYVEIWEKAVRAYNALFEHRHKPQSVVGYNLCPDILIHGSPCQDFSRAGIRLGGKDEDKTRSALLFETLRVIAQMGVWKPKVVIWENVKGVLDKDMINSFNKYIQHMSELGYTTTFEVLNPIDFGIPHGRDRVYAVSILGGIHFDFSKLRRRPMRHISDFLEQDVTGEQYQITIPSMLNKIREFNPNEKPSYRYLDVIEDRCWTITTRQDRCPNAGIIKQKNGGYRYLTERECWRLMGFDDEDFEKVLAEHPTTPGKRNATLYHLAGNSIVVQVLEAIFEVLLNPQQVNESYLTEQNGQLKLVI